MQSGFPLEKFIKVWLYSDSVNNHQQPQGKLSETDPPGCPTSAKRKLPQADGTVNLISNGLKQRLLVAFVNEALLGYNYNVCGYFLS